MIEDAEEIEEIASSVMVRALSTILKNNEGVVIHHDGSGFIVYRNDETKTITIVGDNDYLALEHGKIIEMSYKDMQTPDMGFDDLPLGENTTRH